MSLGWYTVGINSAKEGLDPLLPHVAGVIENMEEATIIDIKSQIEKDLNENVSWSAIFNALENGVRLGLFSMEREFKVCREFTSKEIQKINNQEFTVALPKDVYPIETGKRKRTLMDYVKMQREKRRRKLQRGKGRKQAAEARTYRDNKEIYSQLCQRCKKSIERKLPRSGKDSEMSSEEENRDKGSLDYEASSASAASDMSEMDSKSSAKNSKAPQKSRLLVEKNPMETDPPYYDIFT